MADVQFHDLFPLPPMAAPGVALTESSPGEVRPFGVGFAVDVPADPAAVAEAERAYYDPERQISLVDLDGVTVPMMKRGSGQTTTTTNQHDRNSPDDDTDVGSNH